MQQRLYRIVYHELIEGEEPRKTGPDGKELSFDFRCESDELALSKYHEDEGFCVVEGGVVRSYVSLWRIDRVDRESRSRLWPPYPPARSAAIADKSVYINDGYTQDRV